MDANPPGAPTRITPLPNGPYVVEGKAVIQDSSGKVIREVERISLCRCGHSAKKPFCDGSHARVGFKAE
jgi:CDGSH-type Zn-finger protein